MSSVGLTEPTTVPARGVALVTGGARRIGRAICLTLAQDGYDVAIHHHASGDDARSLAAAIEQLGRRACLLQADLADEAAVRGLIPAAAGALGPVTVLVNNASVFRDDRIGGLTRESWDTHVETNLRAPIVLAEGFAAQTDQGVIINLLDQKVLKPDPRFFSYSLTRNSLWWATQTLAQALAPGIRVNGVGPGPTLPSIHQTPEEFAAEARGTLLEVPGSPEAVADAVLWLIDARMVTGQMIAVDGGQHLAWRTPDIQE